MTQLLSQEQKDFLNNSTLESVNVFDEESKTAHVFISGFIKYFPDFINKSHERRSTLKITMLLCIEKYLKDEYSVFYLADVNQFAVKTFVGLDNKPNVFTFIARENVNMDCQTVLSYAIADKKDAYIEFTKDLKIFVRDYNELNEEYSPREVSVIVLLNNKQFDAFPIVVNHED